MKVTRQVRKILTPNWHVLLADHFQSQHQLRHQHMHVDLFFVCLVWLIEHEYSRGLRPCTVTIPPAQLGGWDGKQNRGLSPYKRLSTR